MAINKKLIHFKKYETFNGSQGINGATEPTNGMYGNIPEHSIVFILDVKKIWTHGQLYDCDLSALEELGLIKALIEKILNTLAADKFTEYDKEYLTFTALEDSSVGFWFYEGSEFELLYSYDRVTWNIYEEEINLPKGNKLYLKADTTEIVEYIGQFYLNGKLDVSGNTMSIVYSDNFVDKVEFPHEGYTLCLLFYECEGLYSVHNLILPATELTNSCYTSMFIGCASLTTAPELPAKTLAENCYAGMFFNCPALTTAPELPATTLISGCYTSMFSYCTSLMTAPELPAKTLAENCYYCMFCGCTSLTTAPVLPATTLAEGCYVEMFRECTNLNYIKMLATDISATECLTDWVSDVASTGTFIKHTNMTSLPTGASGVPEGWTVEEYVSPEDQLKELQVSVDSNTEALTNKANINGDWNEDFNANSLNASELNVGSICFEDSGEYPYIDYAGINYANGETIFFPEYNELMQSSTLATLDDVSGKVSKSELENYLPKSGGSLTGNLLVGNVLIYLSAEDTNIPGGIDLVNGTIEASEVNDFSYVQDSQGNNLLEVLDAKAETYTITDFSAYDIDEISKGTYTLQINPSPLEGAIRNNKVILIQHELGMEVSPVLDAYIEDLIYLTVMYNSCIYLVFIELDLTVLTSASIDCMYNKTDLVTDSVTISNVMTITKDDNDYAHLNISEGLIVDNIIEWKDGSTTVASIDYDGSASFSDLTVAGKNVTSFLTHHNSNINVVTSLSNVPTNKAVVFAHVSTSQELTFDDANLVSGRGVHVFIYNNSSTTPITIIPLLDGSTFLCDNVTEFEIPTQSIAEVSMVYLSSYLSGSLKFIRSITV